MLQNPLYYVFSSSSGEQLLFFVCFASSLAARSSVAEGRPGHVEGNGCLTESGVFSRFKSFQSALYLSLTLIFFRKKAKFDSRYGSVGCEVRYMRGMPMKVGFN